MKPLKNIIALLTNQCNLACPYCFEERDERRMDLETGKDILTYLHKSADSPGFTFFGGEPMLEWDRVIVPLVLWDREKEWSKSRFNMTTNGTLLNEERLEFLFNQDIHFMLSMDGDRETQDSGRPMRNGSSSFDKLMKIIPALLKKRPGQVVRSTLTPASCGRLFDDLMFFEKTGFQNVAVLPDMFALWTSEHIELLAREIGRYESYLIDRYRTGKDPLLFFDYRGSFLLVAQAVQAGKAKQRRTNSECRAWNQCGFGIRGSASADVFGNLYGCHHASPLNRDSPFWIGDVYHGLDTDRAEALIRQYDPMKLGGEKCKDCALDRVCNGGCKPNNYQIFGDLHTVPDIYCKWYQMLSSSAYRVAKLLGSEGNKRFLSSYRSALIGR